MLEWRNACTTLCPDFAFVYQVIKTVDGIKFRKGGQISAQRYFFFTLSFFFSSVSSYRRPIVPVRSIRSNQEFYNIQRSQTQPTCDNANNSRKKREEIVLQNAYYTRYMLVIRATNKTRYIYFPICPRLSMLCASDCGCVVLKWLLASFVQSNQNSESCSVRLHLHHWQHFAYDMRKNIQCKPNSNERQQAGQIKIARQIATEKKKPKNQNVYTQKTKNVLNVL